MQTTGGQGLGSVGLGSPSTGSLAMDCILEPDESPVDGKARGKRIPANPRTRANFLQKFSFAHILSSFLTSRLESLELRQ